ncbi:hypothetical protein [Blastococcus mobilis]|uniref:Lyzozyme M1 (1,4-beta-N-acetylmuramidase), GH25 family n=1 Tax=Blastococcus mobilis TaxID=1938746 RepID=A0A238XYJ5_9ACTN|nr:hypothetical protein [Blastococcus mobilis]SNR63493.1 hypothetical protein SAMN06272737_11679 [Blastococcus mobilis]
MIIPTVPDRHRLHLFRRQDPSPAGQGGRRRRWRTWAAAVLFVTAVHAVVPGAGVAQAAPVEAPPRGVDVSYPQCGRPLPTGQAFAIVGVNGGRATTTNPCLATQLAWAARSTGGTVHDKVQLYVNTGNPGSGAASWPRSGSNRYGACDGSNSRACAYQYGWDRARDDATIRGIARPERYMWWLDVEIVNTWDYSPGGRVRNAAVLEGMTEYFTSIGVRGVGLYSTRYQWGHIVGRGVSATSSLNGLPNWRPAGFTLAAARATCGVAPLTPGGVVQMTQYWSDFDYNHSCI